MTYDPTAQWLQLPLGYYAPKRPSISLRNLIRTHSAKDLEPAKYAHPPTHIIDSKLYSDRNSPYWDSERVYESSLAQLTPHCPFQVITTKPYPVVCSGYSLIRRQSKIIPTHTNIATDAQDSYSFIWLIGTSFSHPIEDLIRSGAINLVALYYTSESYTRIYYRAIRPLTPIEWDHLGQHATSDSLHPLHTHESPITPFKLRNPYYSKDIGISNEVFAPKSLLTFTVQDSQRFNANLTHFKLPAAFHHILQKVTSGTHISLQHKSHGQPVFIHINDVPKVDMLSLKHVTRYYVAVPNSILAWIHENNIQTYLKIGRKFEKAQLVAQPKASLFKPQPTDPLYVTYNGAVFRYPHHTPQQEAVTNQYNYLVSREVFIPADLPPEHILEIYEAYTQRQPALLTYKEMAAAVKSMPIQHHPQYLCPTLKLPHGAHCPEFTIETANRTLRRYLLKELAQPRHKPLSDLIHSLLDDPTLIEDLKSLQLLSCS